MINQLAISKIILKNTSTRCSNKISVKDYHNIDFCVHVCLYMFVRACLKAIRFTPVLMAVVFNIVHISRIHTIHVDIEYVLTILRCSEKVCLISNGCMLWVLYIT